jgi:hypothetical protein
MPRLDRRPPVDRLPRRLDDEPDPLPLPRPDPLPADGPLPADAPDTLPDSERTDDGP